MMGNSNINWYAMSDSSLLDTVGGFIRETRLAQNKTQSQLAIAAGINRSTLSQLENGTGATLFTFIRIMRALQKLEVFEQLVVRQTASPLQLAKLEQSGRQRARNRHTPNDKTNTDW